MPLPPFESSAIDAYPAKSDWDAVSTELFDTVLAEWELSEPEMLDAGEGGVVARVTRPDGLRAVLKVGFPHIEAVWEAAVLDALPDDLAPAVYRVDPWRWATLMESIEPGVPLVRAGLPFDHSLEIAGGLHRRLTACPVPYTDVDRLDDQLTYFLRRALVSLDVHAEAARRHGVPSDRVRDALREGLDLTSARTGTALIHGDFNPGNLISSGDDWRIIDIKPLVGDPAFDLQPLVRDLADRISRDDADLLRRGVVVAARAMGCDPVRAARWARVRAALNVSWCLDDLDAAQAVVEARHLACWDRVAEGLSSAA
ncbi:streptomycin 6-kinase [Diaminobutyricimonas aerilata]|uniref:Streptomycin 6-kinase n=1 Tax=Diaminobutyricimonas aerilata TaxID=1162967 RepID=A0A2M9CJW1_9MICO|nr:aminoglycoside phosphotransferase family protein [Diaminobutyricimonas aerilata]PJJ72184.1 streptomycin 6-kinase [Diaminobutyricimonas aerilata]